MAAIGGVEEFMQHISKVCDIESVFDGLFESHLKVMVGGFGRGGTPFSLIDALCRKHPLYHGLTIIKNDGNEPGLGVDLLFQKQMVTKVISTHIGLNPDLIARMNRGDIAVELHPQGIFAEKIRAAGAGIPAFLSDVGIDTVIANDREKIEFNGSTWLLETALPGDVALLCADVADELGNCVWRGSNRNMSVVMGTACPRVLVEAKKIVAPGEIAPEDVHLPALFVSRVVQAGPRAHMNGGRQ